MCICIINFFKKWKIQNKIHKTTTPSSMESLKELVQVTPSVKCLINQTTMEMNLQGTNKISNQTILTQKTLINREVSLLVAEVATEDLRVVPEVLEDPV